MAEWLKALVLKTSRLKGLVGSNPTSSARLLTRAAACMAVRVFSFRTSLNGTFIIFDKDNYRPIRGFPSYNLD